MDTPELSQYFSGQRKLMMTYSTTFIDYESIDSPIRSILKPTQSFQLSVESYSNVYYNLKVNAFNDMT